MRNLCQESKSVYRHDVVKMLRKGIIQVIISRGSFDDMTVLAKLLREAPKISLSSTFAKKESSCRLHPKQHLR